MKKQAKKEVKKEVKKKVNRSVAKVLNKNSRVQKRMLGMNPYALTLLDPFNYKGVKIPDENMIDSVAFTVVDRRTFTVNPQGLGGVIYGTSLANSQIAAGSLIPIGFTPGSQALSNYAVGMLIGTNATTADLTFGTIGTTGTIPIYLQEWNSNSSTIVTTFDKVRLVSAGLNIQFTGNYTENQGSYLGAFCPRNFSKSSNGNAVSLTSAQQFADSITAPISNNQGITVVYEPQDPESLTYAQIGGPPGQPMTSVYPLTTVSDWETKYRQFNAAELWAIVFGANAGATFQVTASLNYEGIPSQNSLLLTSFSKAEHYDPLSLAQAINMSNDTPNVIASSQEAEGLAFGYKNTADALANTPSQNLQYHPFPVDPPQSKGFLDSLLENAPDWIQKGADLVQKFSPLIEGAMMLI